MFNFQGSEIVIILLLALVVLGPEKLPEAMRKAGQMYGELKKMSSSFQSEFRSVLDEPVREVKETADLLRDSADFTKLQNGERDEKPKSGEMSEAGAMNLAPADPDSVPTDDVPFRPADPDSVPTDDMPFRPAPPDAPTGPTGSDAFGDLPTPNRSADTGTDGAS
ncbi:sec-independent protein translocase protein TatB [Ilumatobacter fluminis]|uniref:Sec-independent protein translocase protein TatB n=1 Tax=Ilumatobacter fluminis TaxID=467091 RepID=A0A4R7I0Q8_9ACTN|nr:twin-arginine translocase TatA/TatE family subunit [Ilumatobacter fluminis]TDT16439.1 sec-independent protein translocase protein TatB [Ilumatobacter fluminis]